MPPIPRLGTMPRMPADRRAPRSTTVPWLLVAVLGWAGFVLIAARLASLDPPRLGDDLRLLVDAGIRWRDGAPLYAPMPPGAALPAESLFYSYPPLVAQAMSLVAGIPFPGDLRRLDGRGRRRALAGGRTPGSRRARRRPARARARAVRLPARRRPAGRQRERVVPGRHRARAARRSRRRQGKRSSPAVRLSPSPRP